MADGGIPEDVERFLLANIDSIAQLEGLLLLQAKPDKAWDVEEIARNLYISKRETTHLLADLELRAMIAAAKSQPAALYRYQPRTPELDALIKHTAEIYRRSLIPVTRIIHSKSKNRVQEFADAFRIRKD